MTFEQPVRSMNLAQLSMMYQKLSMGLLNHENLLKQDKTMIEEILQSQDNLAQQLSDVIIHIRTILKILPEILGVDSEKMAEIRAKESKSVLSELEAKKIQFFQDQIKIADQKSSDATLDLKARVAWQTHRDQMTSELAIMLEAKNERKINETSVEQKTDEEHKSAEESHSGKVRKAA